MKKDFMKNCFAKMNHSVQSMPDEKVDKVFNNLINDLLSYFLKEQYFVEQNEKKSEVPETDFRESL